MAEFDFIGTTDKPALLALSTLEWLAKTKSALTEELGYKVHAADNHEDFLTRFSQAAYQIVVIEELFAASTPAENVTLRELQFMPMNQRRQAVVILLGDSFQTLNTMQAFQQSVHAVVNSAEFHLLSQIIQKTVAENDTFLHAYRDAQKRMLQGHA